MSEKGISSAHDVGTLYFNCKEKISENTQNKHLEKQLSLNYFTGLLHIGSYSIHD